MNGNFVGKKLSQMFCRLWDLLTPVMQSSKTILRKQKGSHINNFYQKEHILPISIQQSAQAHKN